MPLLPILLLAFATSCDANLQPAMAALQQSQPEAAVGILRPLALACTQSPGYFELLGLANELSGHKPEAESALRKATELDPKSPRLLTELGATLFQNGKPVEAASFLDRSLTIDPNNISTLRYAIGASVAAKNWHRSAELFTRLPLQRDLTLLQNEPILAIWFAETFIETGQLTHLDSVLNQQESSLPAGVLFSLGKLFAEHGLYERAIHSLSQVPQATADAAVDFDLGLAYSHLARFVEARTAYFQAIDKNPVNTDAYLHVGLDYVASHQPRMAIPWLYRANSFSPDRADIVYALVEQLIDLAYFDSAKQLIASSGGSNNDPLLLVAQGDLALAQSDALNAASFYQNALAARPDFTPALAGLARADRALGQTNQAQKLLTEALQRAPHDPQLNGELGLLEVEQGDWLPGAQHLKYAWRENQSDPKIALALARVYEREKRPQEALSLLQTLEPLSRNSTAYHLQLERVYMALQLLPKAEAERKLISSLQAHTESGIHFDNPGTYVH